MKVQKRQYFIKFINKIRYNNEVINNNHQNVDYLRDVMNIFTVFNEITPTRNLNSLYIILDSIFLLILLVLLLYKKRYETVLFGIFGGILYLIVDYGGFYLLSHSRIIIIDGLIANNLNTFLVLLWMSLSYGFTNFVFIWVCLAKDKYLKYWLFLIIGWWIVAPSISTLGGEANIETSRTTNAYHGYMGVALIVSYLILIIILLIKKKPFVNILTLNIIGISVQFCWEFALLINGIRPMNELSIKTLLVNSFAETNLGMPACLLIFYLVRSKFSEDLKKVTDKENLDFGIIKLSR